MPGAPKTTPLFDLLSRGAAATQAKPVVRVELKPQASPARNGEAATHAAYPVAGYLRITTNAAYIGVAVVTLLLIGVYIAGFKVGAAKESARVEKELAAAFGSRPAVSETGSTPGQPRAMPEQPRQSPAAQAPANAPLLSTGPILSRLGSIPDPREPGKNYLALARLPKADCESAIRFLAANGVDAIAVPLDSGGKEANNPGPGGQYLLYVLPGFAGADRTGSAAQALEAKVARLGPQWQKEQRGSSDFRMPQWYKKP